MKISQAIKELQAMEKEFPQIEIFGCYKSVHSGYVDFTLSVKEVQLEPEDENDTQIVLINNLS